MKNTKQNLLEMLSLFKAENNRLPTRQDFEAKRIEPSFMTFYRILGNVEAWAKELDLYERGETVFNDPREGAESFYAEASKTKTEFRCVWCGGYIQKPFNYENAKSYIVYRLIRQIKDNPGNGDYQAAVFDSLARIFGTGSEYVEKELRNEGLFNAYQERITIQQHLGTIRGEDSK